MPLTGSSRQMSVRTICQLNRMDRDREHVEVIHFVGSIRNHCSSEIRPSKSPRLGTEDNKAASRYVKEKIAAHEGYCHSPGIANWMRKAAFESINIDGKRMTRVLVAFLCTNAVELDGAFSKISCIRGL